MRGKKNLNVHVYRQLCVGARRKVHSLFLVTPYDRRKEILSFGQLKSVKWKETYCPLLLILSYRRKMREIEILHIEHLEKWDALK